MDKNFTILCRSRPELSISLIFSFLFFFKLDSFTASQIPAICPACGLHRGVLTHCLWPLSLVSAPPGVLSLSLSAGWLPWSFQPAQPLGTFGNLCSTLLNLLSFGKQFWTICDELATWPHPPAMYSPCSHCTPNARSYSSKSSSLSTLDWGLLKPGTKISVSLGSPAPRLLDTE